jgi:hypothetical protein
MPFPMEPKGDNKFLKLDFAEVEQQVFAADDIKITVEQLEILNKVMTAEDGPMIDGKIMKKFKQTMEKFSAQAEDYEDEEPLENNHWRGVRGTEMLVYYPRTARTTEAYEDHTESPGWLNFYNIKDLLARFFVTIHANEGKIRNWRGLCIGITSLDPEEGHLPMFDYDGKNIKTRVKKEVKELQKQFGLGDATIYETRRGLHVYFFSNIVEWDQYQAMLEIVGCCKGFKKSTVRNGYATLRVSAKYTEFDILPYKVIISPHRGENRPGRKTALIRELLRLGQECGTHFASLYPQWAAFQQDVTPWRASGSKGPLRRVKKVSKADYLKRKAANAERHMIKTQKYKMAYGAVKENKDYVVQANNNQWFSDTATTTSATITYTDNSIWTNK